MPAINRKLVIEQGSDWSHGFRVIVDGAYIDETWTAASQVRATAGSATVLYEFEPEVTEDGAVILAVGAAESAAWTWREGVYDIEVTNADESVTLRIVEGKVVVDPEVTR